MRRSSRFPDEIDEQEDEPSPFWTPSDEDQFSLAELIANPAPMDFVVHPYMPAGVATILTGAGGTNKTGLAVHFAVAICAGLELFGERIETGRVLIVSAEDRRAILQRHVWANTRDLSETELARVARNLFVKDVVGSGFKLTRHIDGQTETAIDVEKLIAFATEIAGLRLVVLDTLSRLNGGEETNEDLARFVESMERISVRTGATTLALHHSGKAQMRSDANDQYSGRGGSALSDNARSVMHVARITKDSLDAPSNADEVIREGRLIRLSHVKSNYAAQARDCFFERIVTPYAARLVPFRAVFGEDDPSAAWARIELWLATQKEVPYPTTSTIEGMVKLFGPRAGIRTALEWAHDRGRLIEKPHPKPHGRRRHYLAIPESAGLEEKAA